VLNIECEKCGRRGRYHLHRLIERCGIDAKLFDWSDEITADCPRKQAKNLNGYLWCSVPSSVEGGVIAPVHIAKRGRRDPISRHLFPLQLARPGGTSGARTAEQSCGTSAERHP
jgi:hypothetical protein